MSSQLLQSLPNPTSRLTTTLTSPAVSPRALVAAVARGRIGPVLQVWRERARGRGELRRLLRMQHALGGRALWQDLAWSRANLLAEARKPFWRA